MKVVFTLFLSCFCILQTQAQETIAIKATESYTGKNFNSLNEFYIYGDSKVIGNNILSVDKSDDYNDMQFDNDDLKIKYVDIDNEGGTFSSSSAKLELPDNLKKIAYAGLYWTATYSLEKGKRRKENNNYVYRGDFRKNKDIENIKFKMPGNKYIDLTGDVIYDGATNPTHAINSPYVCYADVTKLLMENEVLNGDYTVANVKASRGYISGGSTAGWLLYIVYQAPTDSPKYITTYNGFALVDDLPVDITFKNFKSVEKGDVKTALTISALEGDLSLMQDECSIIQKDGTFLSLSNGVRNQQNFFNSSITRNSTRNTDRNPASLNTLGFDIAQLEIPNDNNETIDNNTSETTLRLKTGSDRYYVFFIAFQTEISQTFFEGVIENGPSVNKSSTIEPEVLRTPQADAKKSKRKYVWKPPRKLGFDSNAFKFLLSKKSTLFNDFNSGYFVVTNVFSEDESAQKWEKYLIKKGYTPKTFITPNNNWKYVTVLQTESAKEAFSLQQELRQIYRFRDTWILKVNLD